MKRLERTLPIAEEQAAAMKELYEKNMASRKDYLDFEKSRIEHAESLNAERHRVVQLASQIENLEEKRVQILAQAKRNSLSEQDRLLGELGPIRKEIVKAKKIDSQMIIESPVSGVVQELAVNTVGGVVRSAEPLMAIVPRSESLLVEAWVLNKDIGFVREGQVVDVKVNAYNFTKYGSIKGEIKNISQDAVSDEERGLRYLAQIALDSQVMPSGGEANRISPGMSVVAEVKTGQRTIIDFFLSRMKKVSSESLVER